MKQDEMDDFLNKQLNLDFEEQVPESFLRDINKRLDQLEKKRKRRALFFWFFTSFCAVGVVLAMYISFDNKSQLKSTHLQKKPRAQFKKQLQLVQNNQKPKINAKNITKTKQVVQPTKSSNSAILSYQKQYKSIENKVDSKMELAITSLSNIENNKTLNSVQTSSKFPEVHSSVSLPMTESDSVVDTNHSKEMMSENTSDSVTTLFSNSKLNKEVTSNPEKIKKFSLGISFGVSGLFSTINVNNDAQLSTAILKSYRDTRRQQERATSSWDIALRFHMVRNKITIQSGIEFFEWGEQLVYDYNSISGINRYHYLNIPINVGYLIEKKQFGINPFAGFSVGYGIKRNGIYLNQDLNGLSIVSSNKVITTLHVGTELSYNTSQYKVSLIPTYRKSLGAVVNQGLVRNSYSSFGIQMGLSYRF
jgi:hypothetical protein